MSSIFIRLGIYLRVVVAVYTIGELAAIAVYFAHPTPVTLMFAWAGLIIGIAVLLITVIAGQLAKRHE